MVWLWVGPFWWPTGVLRLPGMVSEDLDQPDSIVSLSRRNGPVLSSFGRLSGTAGLGWVSNGLFISPPQVVADLSGPFKAFWSKPTFEEILKTPRFLL